MKKILVIEDEKNIRNRIVDTLELSDEPYKVFAAQNGREGLETARRELPDLIISDVMMPEMDGYEVLKALRAEGPTMTIPFIFLSAKADVAHIREGMNLGADDYLPKPFSIDELLRVVSTRLHRQETQERRSQQELDNVRLRIASSLPHEFRTPLSGLIGFSEMLRAYKNLDDETITMMLDQIRSNAERLQRLVENFLLFAQIEVATLRQQAKQIFPSDDVVLTTDLIEERISTIATKYKRQSDIHSSLVGGTLIITATYIRKILEELVDNACKFSPEGTPIVMTTSCTDNIYTISISDKGRGMTEEEIKLIDVYVQFEREVYEQQGIGLGLALVKRIVQAYNGAVDIQSLPGEGTTITVQLPCKST
jgi:signal transduction histidine kinase